MRRESKKEQRVPPSCEVGSLSRDLLLRVGGCDFTGSFLMQDDLISAHNQIIWSPESPNVIPLKVCSLPLFTTWSSYSQAPQNE